MIWWKDFITSNSSKRNKWLHFDQVFEIILIILKNENNYFISCTILKHYYYTVFLLFYFDEDDSMILKYYRLVFLLFSFDEDDSSHDGHSSNHNNNSQCNDSTKKVRAVVVVSSSLVIWNVDGVSNRCQIFFFQQTKSKIYQQKQIKGGTVLHPTPPLTKKWRQLSISSFSIGSQCVLFVLSLLADKISFNCRLKWSSILKYKPYSHKVNSPIISKLDLTTKTFLLIFCECEEWNYSLVTFPPHQYLKTFHCCSLLHKLLISRRCLSRKQTLEKGTKKNLFKVDINW